MSKPPRPRITRQDRRVKVQALMAKIEADTKRKAERSK